MRRREFLRLSSGILALAIVTGIATPQGMVEQIADRTKSGKVFIGNGQRKIISSVQPEFFEILFDDAFNSIPPTPPSQSDSVSGVITVLDAPPPPPPPNLPPVAHATVYPENGDEPLTVTFDASGSTDPEGAPLNYDWDFGDGNFASGIIVQHIYVSAGDFHWTLTVSEQ